MTMKQVDQLALDEVTITDPVLEKALEDRLAAKLIAAVPQHDFMVANEAAKAEIAKLELPDGKAARVGRFRLTRVAIEGGEFERKASTRVTIKLVDA